MDSEARQRDEHEVRNLDGLALDPYLPEVADLYWIDTTILQRFDKRPFRPAVVIRVPESIKGRVGVVTRTTDLTRPGIAHPADAALGLFKDGVFAYVRSAVGVLWHRPNVRYVDKLDPALVGAILKRFSS